MIPEVSYKLRYSRRAKRLSLQVVPGEVRVIAPAGVNITIINEFVRSRAGWLTEKLAYFASVVPPSIPTEFIDGSEVSVLGRKVVLQLSENASEVEELVERNGILYAYLSGVSGLAPAVRKWLDDQLLSHVKGIVEKYSHQRLVPSGIKLRSASTRWGSCNSCGVIMINRRLVHAPLNVVEYVVVHELAHLIHRNHSNKFWKVVESILGDVKQDKQWLRLQGAYLLH